MVLATKTDCIRSHSCPHRYRGAVIRAGVGEDSSKARILGRRGKDIQIEVPVGVAVYDEQRKLLGELNNLGETCVVAGGGVGGCAGCDFIGKRGQEHVITIDLKLIADVGMVRRLIAGAESVFLGPITNIFCHLGGLPECRQKYPAQGHFTRSTENCILSM